MLGSTGVYPASKASRGGPVTRLAALEGELKGLGFGHPSLDDDGLLIGGFQDVLQE